jgi:Trk K+ transport system NAD-binding subunit
MRKMRSQQRLLALFCALAVLAAAGMLLLRAGVDAALVALIASTLAAAILLLALPLYVLPALAHRAERRLPTSMPPLANGVLFFRAGTAVSTLLGKIERSGLETVILETDEATARGLVAHGQRVIFASPSGGLGRGVLDGLDLGAIRAIVANGSDPENAALTLAARQDGYEGEILVIAEQAHHRKPLMLAGASRVFAPRQMLAAALVARASERISPRIVGAQALGRKLVVSEVKVGAECPVVGQTLKSADVGRHAGVTVIGRWRNGELTTPVDADDVLDPDVILIVAGSHESIARFREACAEEAGVRSRTFVVAGCGEIGRAAAMILRGAGEHVITVDKRPGDWVDIVGEISNPDVLDASGLRDARAVLLALGNDSTTLFAALAVRDHAPDVPILAAVSAVDTMERIRRAGADYALSLSQVSSQLVASRLLGHESILIHPSLEVRKVASDRLAGRHPAELAIRERTNAFIVAIERGDEVIVALDPAFTFAEGDVVYVCGNESAIDAFTRTFPEAEPRAAEAGALAAGEQAAV